MKRYRATFYTIQCAETGERQYVWRVYTRVRGVDVFVCRYVAMVDAFWAGVPLSNI